jgi:Tetratricopeptide repeat
VSRRRRAKGGRAHATAESTEPTSRRTSAAPAAPRAAPVPLSHPALLLAGALAAACVVITVSFKLWETDFWQHLLVGKAIWALHRVPVTQLWSWPTYGAPDVNPSWGFSALIWPVWQAGGITALFAWRWATTLGAFVLLWLAARRMGSRGFTALVVIAVCALMWRDRSQVRPETLVAVLFALQIWILETRRAGGPDRSLWLIPLAWVWVNVHLSYHLGLAMIAIHVLNDLIAPRITAGRALRFTPAPGRLALVGLLAFAISFVNPFGWHALWQPFEYQFFWRHEPIYAAIAELQPLFPLAWQSKIWTGLPLWLAAWPVLAILRTRRPGLDVVEWLTCALYTSLAVGSVRFVGFYALAAAPFLARDLGEWAGRTRLPDGLASPWARAGLASLLCVALALPQWTHGEPLGVGFAERRVPKAACDFMLAHDVGGHGFNPFYFGGYMLWRFWPEKDRLPFMDIHQSGSSDERDRYVRTFTQPEGWNQLDTRYRFDYALLDAAQDPPARDPLRDLLDADPRFALVFRDDAAALYVRREGRNAEVASALGYHLVPGGDARLPAFGRAVQADSTLRSAAKRELERQVAESVFNADAHSLLANLAFLDHDPTAAKAHLEASLAANPGIYGAHERLALIAMQAGDAAEAVRHLQAELRVSNGTPLLARRLAEAYQQLGNVEKAREWYGRAGLRSPSPSSAAPDTSGG